MAKAFLDGSRKPARQMNFKLLLHAQEQLVTRALPFYPVEMVLENPQQIIESEGTKVYQWQFDYNGKMQLLRVGINDIKPIVVVTIYVTSKISKSWKYS